MFNQSTIHYRYTEKLHLVDGFKLSKLKGNTRLLLTEARITIDEGRRCMFRRLGKAVEFLPDTPVRTGIGTAVVIVFFGGLEFALHLGLPRIGVPRLLEAAINATFVGCFAGLAMWIMLRAVRDRRIRRMDELRKIAELNHEVRNALEVIADSHFAAEPEHRELVLDSVARVSKVLKKVFPPRAA